MSGTRPVEREADGSLTEARHGIEQAETGNRAGIEQLGHAEASDPAAAQAAEQEAADGPEGRGLSR